MIKCSTATSASPPNVKLKQDLQVQRLKSLALFTVPNILSAAECDAFIKYAEELGFSHQGSLGPAKGEAFRDNDRISVQDRDLAQNLWLSGLSNVFENVKVDGKSASGLNPNIRFYRYREGQKFGPHIDENVYLHRGQRTEYTLLVYLNGNPGMKSKKSSSKGRKDTSQHLQGGETIFYPGHRHESIEVAPVAGMALFHVHGENCMLHEARVVSKGIKYVLRSDVIFG
ncbi:hypothetical protein GOP47_0003042 [Adiantum capillus-veneris]|uniref:Fe2OG dioxygenase domain-containing protein n=1 Tax=Adiantum capillus-veneris TaxID=13818 RepID=A0A9D4VC07_ADICA|nr:hypothetical protein GOP47_0003042 [Adiantum capillus-veneris]